MNKILRRALAATLLVAVVLTTCSCGLIDSILGKQPEPPAGNNPPSSNPPDDTPVLTGVDKVIADARAATDKRIEEIRNAPNMEIPEDATVYYVSEYGDDENDGLTEDTAWLTLDKVNAVYLTPGTYVCFQRGSTWRGYLNAQPGVTYTAYGEGDKPILMASPENGADPDMWEETEYENVWKYKTKFDLDVGCIIFNEGEFLGEKQHLVSVADTDNTWTFPAIPDELKSETYYNGTTMEKWEGLSSMSKELQFFHSSRTTKLCEGDINDKVVYLYCEGNPGEKYDSIEFNIRQHIINAEGKDITINNLCLKYTGAHGVSAVNVENLTTSELEVGYIGGSIQSGTTRFGNGIQVWNYCDGWVCEDNYVYQCYDAGITPQTNASNIATSPYNQHNMTIKNNVIEKCVYSIEYFISSEDVMQYFKNFIIEDNYMWYAGEGICETRRDREVASHLKGRGAVPQTLKNYAENFVIRNNVMIGSTDFVFETRFSGDSMTEEMKENSKPLYENNIMVAGSHNYAGIGFYVWEKGVRPEMIDFDEDLETLLNSEYGSGNECWIKD